MKRLLLSTTLVLGTLSGVRGSAANLDSISHDVARLHTDVQSVHASQASTQTDITALPTALHRLTPEVRLRPWHPQRLPLFKRLIAI